LTKNVYFTAACLAYQSFAFLVCHVGMTDCLDHFANWSCVANCYTNVQLVILHSVWKLLRTCFKC